MYEPIPSTNYQYEITPRGHIRNAKTKQLIRNRSKPKNRKCICVELRVNGKRTCRTTGSLLAEVYGVETPQPFNKPPVGVTIIKGNIRKSFPSRSKCAAYLETVTRYKRSYLMRMMSQRESEIDGWQLLYREPEKRIFRSTTLINGDKDLRHR